MILELVKQRIFEYEFNCKPRPDLENKFYECLFNETKGIYERPHHYHRIVEPKQHYNGSIYGFIGSNLVEGLLEKDFKEKPECE